MAGRGVGDAKRCENLLHDLLRTALDRNDDRVFIRCRLLERRELALEQARRHEVLMTGGDAPRNELDVAPEADQAHVRAFADDNLAVATLERRAGDHAAFAGAAL